MTKLKDYIDDLWARDVRSFSQLSPHQCTTLMGYILRDEYDSEINDFMCELDPKHLINYLIAHDLGNPDMLEWIDMMKEKRKKALDSIKSQLSISLKDTIDELFTEKELEAENDPELDPDRFHDYPDYYRCA